MKLSEATDVMEPKLADPALQPVTKRPKSYMCVLHNDEYTDGMALMDLIATHFEHSQDAAMRIVLRAHQDGSSPCGGPYSKDIAESKADNAMKGAEMHPSIGGGPAPLKISVEEVETE
jgi:ATP-dependent Clp protease adaptor protein ClpS